MGEKGILCFCKISETLWQETGLFEQVDIYGEIIHLV